MMLPLAASHNTLTTGQQLALVLVMTGACYWIYVLARGAAYLLLGVGWFAVLVFLIVMAAGEWTVHAHRRGVQRVRRYEAKEADRGRPGRAVRAGDAVRGVP